MTLNEVRDWVDRVKAAANYRPDMAHMEEDLLYLFLLQALKHDTRVPADLRTMITEALKTQDHKFPRWG